MRKSAIVSLLFLALAMSSAQAKRKKHRAGKGLMKAIIPGYRFEFHTGKIKQGSCVSRLRVKVIGTRGSAYLASGVRSRDGKTKRKRLGYARFFKFWPTPLKAHFGRDLGELKELVVTHHLSKRESKHIRKKFKGNIFDRLSYKLRKRKAPYKYFLRPRDWYLDKVIVHRVGIGKKRTWIFPCYRWLSPSLDDRKMTRHLLEVSRATEYRVTVYTGSRKGSGTNGKIRMTLLGSKGELFNFQLDDPRNNFERYMCEHFRVFTKDLGKLKRIDLHVAPVGKKSAWYCERVLIQRRVGSTFRKVGLFNFRRWFSKKRGWDHSISVR